MKIYKTQSEVEKDIKNRELFVDGDVKFECSFVIKASIRVTGDIKANDIDAGDINARNIDAYDIKASNIKAYDIKAYDINAGDIDANNINAGDIDANNIKYWGVCFAYCSFICNSVEGQRENSKHFCLDDEIEFKEKEDDKTEILIKDGKKYKLVEIND